MRMYGLDKENLVIHYILLLDMGHFDDTHDYDIKMMQRPKLKIFIEQKARRRLFCGIRLQEVSYSEKPKKLPRPKHVQGCYIQYSNWL